MRNDGNLVSYDLNNNMMWDSGTAGNPGSYLMVHDDGFLAIYKPNAPDPIWQEPRG